MGSEFGQFLKNPYVLLKKNDIKQRIINEKYYFNLLIGYLNYCGYKLKIGEKKIFNKEIIDLFDLMMNNSEEYLLEKVN